MSVYLPNNEFLSFYDRRRVASFLSDTGTPIADGLLATDPILARLINAAEGKVNIACRVGRRYDLGSLASYAATDAGNVLKELVADLAWHGLISRRGFKEEETAALAPRYAMAEQTLELLRLGERVFEIDDAPQAGLPGYTTLGSLVTTSIKYKTAFWGTFCSNPQIVNGCINTGRQDDCCNGG